MKFDPRDLQEIRNLAFKHAVLRSRNRKQAQSDQAPSRVTPFVIATFLDGVDFTLAQLAQGFLTEKGKADV